MTDKIIRIGGASGFWGDAARATPQLLAAGGLDFIVYDYLAEITMSIMARARAKDPEKGYAVDFVSAAMKPNLPEIANQGVRIIANAGGVNPQACAAALRAVVVELGLNLKVACVLGDDLIEQREQLAMRELPEMFSGESFPAADRVQSINAYLGAFPVAKALDLGADIIVTGRGVDSAVTLGACIHTYGWARDDYDKLAMGSLAGHILECGPQATGGNFTDWETVDRIDEIGYPIAELSADGSFTCTKPDGTGGMVTIGTVAEQMVYEIGDPQAYMLPDVVCDFSQVQIKQTSADTVCVTGAIGRPAPDTYKVSATYADQFRGGTYMTFYGFDADKKALALADAVFKASRRIFKSYNLPDFSETSVELIGAESQYGAHRKISGSREVAAKVAVKHPDMMGIGIMLKEAVGLGLATPPGLSGFQGGRPKPSPVVRLFSLALPKADIPVQIEINGDTVDCDEAHGEAFNAASIDRPAQPGALESQDLVEVPLIALAWGRSGDKGNKANIGIIAREPEYLPYIYAALTEKVVTDRFAHFLEDLQGSVERFLMPGANAINFLLHDVLGGGGVASIRNDAQGKGYAQLLLDVPIPVPQKIAEQSAKGTSGTDRGEN
ncbi:MAG: acyclic terpene utilization AtuA family protein [Pseudomonadales bacterium]